MASGHRWNLVGDEFVRLFMAEYGDGERPLHWPTAIGAASCLCGETALMARESRLPEHGIIDSTKVAELLYNGEATNRTILGYSMTIAKQAFGVEVETMPTYRDMVEQFGTQLLPGSFPALTVSTHIVPHETPMNAGPRLRKTVHGIANREGLGMNDSSFALATAAMKMVGSAQELGIRDLTLLVLQCVVAGSRFAPALSIAPNPAFRNSKAEEAEALLDAEMRAEEAAAQMPAAAAVAAALGTGERSAFGRRR